MSDNHTERLAKVRTKLRVPLRSLLARVKIMRATASLNVATADRALAQIKRAQIARDKNRSRDQLVYSKGSAAERIGYLELDDYAIVGLEGHGVLYALWMAKAAMECEARNRGELLRQIFSDPRRLEFCRAEGARISLEWSKAADERRAAEFRAKDAAGNRNWRKNEVTSLQQHRMKAISIRCNISIPPKLRCGTAQEWIAIHSARPEFWKIPERLPDWEIE